MAGERTVRGGLLDAMRAELEPQLAEIRGRLAALEARPLPSADPLRAVPKYGPPPFEDPDPERLRQLVEELSEPQQDGDPSCILNREASSYVADVEGYRQEAARELKRADAAERRLELLLGAVRLYLRGERTGPQLWATIADVESGETRGE